MSRIFDLSLSDTFHSEQVGGHQGGRQRVPVGRGPYSVRRARRSRHGGAHQAGEGVTAGHAERQRGGPPLARVPLRGHRRGGGGGGGRRAEIALEAGVEEGFCRRTYDTEQERISPLQMSISIDSASLLYLMSYLLPVDQNNMVDNQHRPKKINEWGNFSYEKGGEEALTIGRRHRQRLFVVAPPPPRPPRA